MRASPVLFGLLLLARASGSAHAEEKPAPAAPAARVVILHNEELLKSEAKAIAAMQKKLQRGGYVVAADAGSEEKAIAAAWLAREPPASPPPWPDAWRGADTVVVLQVLPPTGKKPARISAGFGGRLVFRAPEAAPVYVERFEGKSGLTLNGEDLAKWIEGARRVVEGKGK